MNERVRGRHISQPKEEQRLSFDSQLTRFVKPLLNLEEVSQKKITLIIGNEVTQYFILLLDAQKHYKFTKSDRTIGLGLL